MTECERTWKEEGTTGESTGKREGEWEREEKERVGEEDRMLKRRGCVEGEWIGGGDRDPRRRFRGVSWPSEGDSRRTPTSTVPPSSHPSKTEY